MRHHVALIDDLGAEALGFPIGIGDGADLIEAELAGAGEVGIDQDPVVRGERAIVAADVFGGKLHEDGHPREMVGGTPIKGGEVALEAGHDRARA